ncbi:hypothetical protein [Gordonia sp. NB41Y]|nr:hypothetical protein [Gordonia sp. NB41Y]WLP90501.1 hypothetical protein Q9K23_23865 [Gordonia sp. NB41Y]
MNTTIAGTLEPIVASDIVPMAHTSKTSRAIDEIPSTARLST